MADRNVCHANKDNVRLSLILNAFFWFFFKERKVDKREVESKSLLYIVQYSVTYLIFFNSAGGIVSEWQ